jgi:K+-sensing histidine kinase KdpD
VEIQIWDTGRGIPADQQAMVFEEFVQLQNPARDREVTGRGSMFCPEIGDLPATGSSRAPPPAAAQGLSTLASLPTTKYDICRIAQRRR